MKLELYIPVAQNGEPVLRSRCAFESASSAYDYACFKGYTSCSTKEVTAGDHDSYLVMDRQGMPTRVIHIGDSFKIQGVYDDWYVCEQNRLFFQRQNGEFFEIPQNMTGKPELITAMLEKGDEFKFRSFMYAYLTMLHNKGIQEISIKTEAFPDDNA